MKIGTKVKYLGQTATVTDRWWDGEEWRLTLEIRRGKYAGEWSVKEETVSGDD
jgi:hypothetical protein